MTPAPRHQPAAGDPGRLRLAAPTDRLPKAPAVERLLWGWPEVLSATGICRRTLERELSAGRFPRPVLRVGRRPYWKPADVIRWAEGGKS